MMNLWKKLLTDSTTAIQYSIMGAMKWDYGVWFFVIGLLSAIVGQFLALYVFHKLKRSSFIAFGISAVIAISAVLMSAVGVANVVHDVSKGKSLGLKSFCKL